MKSNEQKRNSVPQFAAAVAVVVFAFLLSYILPTPPPPPHCWQALQPTHTYTHQLAYIIQSPLTFIEFSVRLCLLYS